jgi:hypothetical protein
VKIGRYEFADEAMEQELQFYPAQAEGPAVETDKMMPMAWRICFKPEITARCGAHIVTGYSCSFGRKQDVDVAIEALKKAGITTARQLLDRERVQRVISEAMQW